MSISETAFLTIPVKPFDESALSKGLFICLLHTKRVPPHIGIVVNGLFHSLTIKGAEPDINIKALLKTIALRKIETVFLKTTSHPVYSLDHLNAVFLEILKKYPVIKGNTLTCLSPVKEFFNEYYALNSGPEDIIYSFLDHMNKNSFILEAYSLNLTLGNNAIEIPIYSQEELTNKIKDIRTEYYGD